MSTITLDVPDELAERLTQKRSQLPALLSLALELTPETEVWSFTAPISQTTPLMFQETIDFLASGPTSREIVVFKASPTTQARLDELLDKNREGELTDEEAMELELFAQINRILLLLKAQARFNLSSAHTRRQ